MDCLEELDAKRAKCNQQINELTSQMKVIRTELACINENRVGMLHKINHPLHSFFTDIFPITIIDICCSLASIDYCAQCAALYPRLLGCLNCLKRYKHLEFQCVPQEVRLNAPNSLKNIELKHIEFSDENDIEMWEYVQETLNNDEIYLDARPLIKSRDIFFDSLKISIYFKVEPPDDDEETNKCWHVVIRTN